MVQSPTEKVGDESQTTATSAPDTSSVITESPRSGCSSILQSATQSESSFVATTDRQTSGRTGSSLTAANKSRIEVRKSLKAAGRALSLSKKRTPTDIGEKTSAVPDLLVRNIDNEGSATDQRESKEGSKNIVLEPVSPEKLDTRGNKFFFSQVNSEAIKSCGLLGDNVSHIRIPVLVMAEYSGPISKTRWHIDAFSLPHNAIRRECMDMYDIIMALARSHGAGDLTFDDISDFHDWWAVTYDFLRCYFEVERKVLFPWIDGAGAKDAEIQLALRKMRGMKDTLQEQLLRLNEVWSKRSERRSGEMFAHIYKAVDEFAPKLMNYFADQEILLPAIVKSAYTYEGRVKIDKNMIEEFLGGPLNRKTRDDAHHNIVLLSRWIANPRQLRAWVSKNLTGACRNMYPKWHSMFEEQHHQIVRLFRNRNKGLPIPLAQSALPIV